MHPQPTVAAARLSLDALRSRIGLFFDGDDPVSVVDVDGTIVDANDGWWRLLGYTPTELIGTSLAAYAPAGAGADLSARFADVLAKKSGRMHEVPTRHRDGSVLLVDLSWRVTDVDGRVVVVIVVRAARPLNADAARYRALIARIPEIVYTCDVDANTLTVTENVLPVLGRTADELLGPVERRAGLLHPDDVRRNLPAIHRAFATHGSFDVEVRMLHKNGSWVWMRNRLVSWDTVDGKPVVTAVLSDISERKRLEEELRQAQKMSAIGQLTGGIAHDFNNIMSIILGTSEVLLRDLDVKDPRREELDDIKFSAERAVALTRQLLAISRRQASAAMCVDVGAVVGGLEPMLRRLLGGGVQLSVDVVRDAVVWCDRSQLEQVVLNLVINARDAMAGRGRLGVSVAVGGGGDDVPAGDWVVVGVSDDGCGISDDVKAHIFDAFFTTKEPGKGTGLGLSTCKSIVEQNRGRIVVDSVVGSGTTFRVYLPRAS